MDTINEIKRQELPEEQEIDLIELAQKLWKERKFLLKGCGIAVVVGLIVAFSIPKEYTTTVKLAPETQDAAKKSSLGGLAAMAGINLNAAAGADAISPDLYPDVVQSTPFLLELFPVEVTDKEKELSTTLYDLIELAQKLWKERKFLLKGCGIAVVVGLIVAFSIPKEYTTTVKLAPETQDAAKKSSLGGLAAMAGINLNAAAGADAISPDLYPDVVQSTPFLLELFPVEVTDKEKELSTTLYDYMSEHQRKAWWGYIVSAPFKALGAVMSLISGDEEESEGLNPYHLTKDQEEVVKALQERVSVSVDKKTLVITASVQMQDPVISAQMTKVVLENLQNYITNYRTQKVKQDLEFTQKVFGESRDAYYKAQRAYAAFEDANRNIISSSYRTEQERLKNEMTLTFNVYNTLAQKLEQDKLRVQEETPVYTVIEPATVPLKASSPKKALILVGFVFLALFGCIGYLFVKDMFVAAFKKEETGA